MKLIWFRLQLVCVRDKEAPIGRIKALANNGYPGIKTTTTIIAKTLQKGG